MKRDKETIRLVGYWVLNVKILDELRALCALAIRFVAVEQPLLENC